MAQAVKNMVQHEPHFILEVVDNGFGSLAMGACVNLRSRRVFNLKRLIKRDKEKVRALGANGVMSGSRVGVVWMEVGGGIVRARVVSRVVVMVVWMVLRGFWIEELALEAMELDDQRMEYEKGEKHSVGKCHIGTLGHTHHSVGNVIDEVEGFFNGEAVEHITKASIWMVFVFGETYGIFTQDDFPLFKLNFQLGDNHLKGIKDGINPFHLLGLGLSSFIV
ncbi:hypothetical protein Tco_0981881 [Tanacetum coccineum]